MRIHLCDVCGDNLIGERMYILDCHFYNDYSEKMPAIPLMELCPPCKEWLRECITMKKYKEEERTQQEEL
jgi:hypothetical protein